jgi:hypothetical protein
MRHWEHHKISSQIRACGLCVGLFRDKGSLSIFGCVRKISKSDSYLRHVCLSVRMQIIFWKLTVYEIMWKNIVEPDRLRMAIWRMRVTCWIPKATNTNTHRINNNYCFSTAALVAGMLRNVMFICSLSFKLSVKGSLGVTKYKYWKGWLRRSILKWRSEFWPVTVDPRSSPVL